MIKMKYIEDSEDLEFPYCKTINDNNKFPISIQNNESPHFKRKFLFIIIIIILCIIIVGLSIFLIIYFSSTNEKVEYIININPFQSPPKENYITAKYIINSDDNLNLLFNIPENSSESNFTVNEIGNKGRILGETKENTIYIENDTYIYNSSKNKNITIEIIIDKNLESISRMFLNNKNLVEVNFTNFVSNKISNMESIFLNCTSLESVNFINFNYSNIEIMDNAFENCDKLTILNLSSTTHKLKSINSMFKDCANLFLIDVSGFKYNENVNINDTLLNENVKIIKNFNIDDLGKDFDDCDIGDNEKCKTCSTKKNRKFVCEQCNDGYMLLNVQYPIKCKQKCYIKNCDSCINYFSCDKCINGFTIKENKCIPKNFPLMPSDSISDLITLSSSIDKSNDSSDVKIQSTSSNIISDSISDLTTLSSPIDILTDSSNITIQSTSSNTTSDSISDLTTLSSSIDKSNDSSDVKIQSTSSNTVSDSISDLTTLSSPIDILTDSSNISNLAIQSTT